ncbi:MAG: outer membrane beta-barrel protein [bacterium]
MNRRPLQLLMVLLLLGLVSPASATGEPAPEQPDPDRWQVGLDILSSRIDATELPRSDPVQDVQLDQSAVGAALYAGYDLTATFQLRLYISGTVHESTDPDREFRMTSATLEAAYRFRAGQPLRPYLFGGAGAFNLRNKQEFDTYTAEGAGVSCGGGLYYFLSRHFALHLSVRGEFINWSKTKTEDRRPPGEIVREERNIEDSATSGEFTFGAAYEF